MVPGVSCVAIQITLLFMKCRLIQKLNVKGANFTAKRGTTVRGISLVADNAEQLEGKVNGQQIVILTKFVNKSN